MIQKVPPEYTQAELLFHVHIQNKLCFFFMKFNNSLIRASPKFKGNIF